MRPLRALIAIVFLALGVVLGALNPESASVDLGVVKVKAGLGVIVLCALLAGVLVGGLSMVVSVVLPMRRELRRMRKSVPRRPDADPLLPVSPSPES
jgi:lipopolysaccharide assembly protein A